MIKQLRFVLLVILFSTFSLSYAQRLGLKIAFSKPELNFDNFKQDNTQIYQGYQIGIYGRSDSRIYLQPEIYYQKKQGLFIHQPNMPNYVMGDSIYNQSVVLHTINVPLVIGLNVIKHKKFTLHGFAGIQSCVVVDNQIASYSRFTPLSKNNIENITVKYFWGLGIDIFFVSFDVRYYTDPTNPLDDYENISFPYLRNYYTFNIGLKILK